MKEKYGLQFKASDLELWHAHISECNIQAQIKRGFATTVSVKIDGGTEHSFLDLRIVDPDNNQLQCPNPSKWEYDSDTGKFDLEFSIPLGCKLGEYNAVILLWRDVKLECKDAPEGIRHILDFQEKAFRVIA